MKGEIKNKKIKINSDPRVVGRMYGCIVLADKDDKLGGPTVHFAHAKYPWPAETGIASCQGKIVS